MKIRREAGRVNSTAKAAALLDHAGLIGELQDCLGVPVDVIDADGMLPRLRAEVERDTLPIEEARGFD